jgi:hypothetical protein
MIRRGKACCKRDLSTSTLVEQVRALWWSRLGKSASTLVDKPILPIDSSGSWPGCAGDKWPALRADIVGFGRALPSRLPTRSLSLCSLRQALPARGPALRATLSGPPAAARGLLSAVRGDLLKVSAPEECQTFPSLQRNKTDIFVDRLLILKAVKLRRRSLLVRALSFLDQICNQESR